jgi:hypothetical protein
MGEPAKPAPQQRPWVAAFATRLCLFAWGAAVLTELLPPSKFESFCILIGSQASILGLLTCLFVGLRFRQGVFLLLLLATSAPAAYFAIVVQQIARQQGWLTN